MRVFISYGHDEHVNLAQQLKMDLEARGHEVWFDKERLRPGADFEQYIDEGLNWTAEDPEQARMVLLMTPHSVRRPDGYCLNELAIAFSRKIFIIPVMVVWCEPPLSICRIQWLDMRDCVPAAKHPERYQLKRARLIEALEEGKLDFEASQATLFQQLQPIDFTADLSRHVSGFVGRRWVLDRIDKWVQNPGVHRVFWITGEPGVGKTALAAYLCHKRSDVVAFHLCRYGHDDKSDPRRCVTSLAFQLSSQLFDYQKRLLPLLWDMNKSPGTLFDSLIVQPLSQLAQAPPHPYLIIIDGIDEATKQGKNELAEFIAAEFPRTPPWLLLVITSRPDREVVQPLQRLVPHYLDAGLPENLADIRGYLNRHLQLLYPQQPPDQQIIESIVRKSEGVFLYAEQVLEDLKAGLLSLERIEDFPQGLGGIYLRLFARQFPEVVTYQTRHRPFLEMVLASRGPLSLKLAQAALQWGPYDYQVDAKGEAGGAALTPLGSLFPQDADHIRPFHHSLVDWLTNPAGAGDYFVEVREGQKRLTDVCWAEYRAGLDSMSSYAVAHLPTHLVEMGRWDDLLELISCPGLGLIRRWIEEGEGEKGLSCLAGLISHLGKNGQQQVLAAGLSTQAARIHALWGEYNQARNWLNMALKRTSWWRGRREQSIALHELGSLALYKHNFAESKYLYHRALRRCLWGWPRYHDEAAANLVGLATVSYESYDFAETIRYATQAIREAKIAGDLRHLIAGERLLGAAFKSLGRFGESHRHLQDATWLCQKFRISVEKARLCLLRGWLEFDQATMARELPNAARLFFHEALEAAKQVRDWYCLVEAKLSLVWLALAIGATEEAREWLASLWETLPRDQHQELRAGVKLGRAGLAQQSGELAAAGKIYQEVSSFCAANDIRGSHYKALVGLAAIQWHTEKPEAAEKTWAQAVAVAGSISPGKVILAQISIELCRKDWRTIPR